MAKINAEILASKLEEEFAKQKIGGYRYEPVCQRSIFIFTWEKQKIMLIVDENGFDLTKVCDLNKTERNQYHYSDIDALVDKLSSSLQL